LKAVEGRITAMELLEPKEVSLLTGLSIETLAQWRSQKKHIPYLKMGRRVRYHPSDIEEYLGRCRVSVRKETQFS
jgi:predicted DNA-binding transcriptional regulator AlpA